MEYLILEGIDGVGKTTTINQLKETLEAQGHKVLVLVEPGTTELGMYFRGMMKQNPTSNFERVLMMYLSRYSMVLSDFDWTEYDYVISDRCWLSTLAYQLSADPNLLQVVVELQRDFVRHWPKGNLYIIDGTPELAATRREERGGKDHLENFTKHQAELMYQLYRSVYTKRAVDYVDSNHQFSVTEGNVCRFVHQQAENFNRVAAINAQWTTEQQVQAILMLQQQAHILDRSEIAWGSVAN